MQSSTELRRRTFSLSNRISSQLSPEQFQQQYRHFFNNHPMNRDRLKETHSSLGQNIKIEMTPSLDQQPSSEQKQTNHSIKVKRSNEELGMFAINRFQPEETIMLYPGLLLDDIQPFLNRRNQCAHNFIDDSYKVALDGDCDLLSGGIVLSYAFCAHLCNDAIL